MLRARTSTSILLAINEVCQCPPRIGAWPERLLIYGSTQHRRPTLWPRPRLSGRKYGPARTPMDVEGHVDDRARYGNRPAGRTIGSRDHPGDQSHSHGLLGSVTGPLHASRATPRHHSSLGRRIALALLPPLGAILMRLHGATLRFQEIGDLASHADAHPETRVYCLWHRSLMSIAYHFRKRKIAILISPSFDGELITHTIRRVGYTPVRGSSSREGASGLLRMQSALSGSNGSPCNYAAFTADGPRGPVYVAKPGGVKLAQMLGGGVGIFYAAPDRAWVLRSWDGFLIPKPFSTVFLNWQPPVPVAEDAGPADLEKARQAVELALERARHAVEEHIHRTKMARQAAV